MSKTELQLNIISAEKKIFSGSIASVTLPGTLGGFTILPDHAPLISSLKEGVISYVTGGDTVETSIKSGFVEVNQNVVTVTVE